LNLNFKDIVNYLIRCEDLQTPKEYLGYYTRPFNITLESGSYYFLNSLNVLALNWLGLAQIINQGVKIEVYLSCVESW